MKSTRAFSLKPMEKVELVWVKGGDGMIWVPLQDGQKTHVFVYGRGCVKIPAKAKKVLMEPLPENWTAEQVKKVCEEYGISGAQSMLKGWGNQSLWDDRSYGLAYHKAEVGNMCRYGKVYDDFTDEVQEIGDGFVSGLLSNGFRMEGKWMWHGENLALDSSRTSAHPLMYVDHLIFGVCRVSPIFDSLSFDGLLAKLFVARCGSKSDYVLGKKVSVRDRIAYLTDKKTADAVGSIFELQKVFDG